MREHFSVAESVGLGRKPREKRPTSARSATAGKQNASLIPIYLLVLFVGLFAVKTTPKATPPVVTTEKLKTYVEQFNADYEKLYSNIPNEDAFSFLEKTSTCLNVRMRISNAPTITVTLSPPTRTY